MIRNPHLCRHAVHECLEDAFVGLSVIVDDVRSGAVRIHRKDTKCTQTQHQEPYGEERKVQSKQWRLTRDHRGY